MNKIIIGANLTVLIITSTFALNPRKGGRPANLKVLKIIVSCSSLEKLNLFSIRMLLRLFLMVIKIIASEIKA